MPKGLGNIPPKELEKLGKFTPKELEKLAHNWDFHLYEMELTKRCEAYIKAERAAAATQLAISNRLLDAVP